MRREITMPQLGMTQDSGVIVSWGKKPGDRVKADDILMEVETDKSTMEVEVGHDGFLAEVRAAAGAAVPVGDVVAVISDDADDVVTEVQDGRSAEEASDRAGNASEEGPPAAREPSISASPGTPGPGRGDGADSTAPAPQPSKPGGRGDGRILASAKAKLEAERRGIDLSRLVRQGLPQPFHVADLEKLVPERQAGGTSLSALSATTERCDFEAFCDWVRKETDGGTDQGAIWAAFASAAWRACLGLDGPAGLTVRVETLVPIPSGVSYEDADVSGLGGVAPAEDAGAPDLVVLDLTGTGLADYRSGGSSVPTLTVAESGDTLRVTLGFDEAVLPVASAAALLSGIAGRLREPLRHLL